MKQLISYKTQRALNIAEAVIYHKTELSQQEIQKMNNCSTKTVLDDLQYIQNEWGHIINLKIDNGYVSSINNNIYDLLIFKTKLFHDEIKIRLLLSIFMHPNLTIPEHANKLAYSESHLRRQITPLNNYLQNYSTKIDIDSESRGFFIESSNEVSTVFLISQFIKVSSNKEKLKPLSNEDLDFLTPILGELFPNSPKRNKINVTLFYQTLLIRIKQGFPYKQDFEKIAKKYEILESKRPFFDEAMEYYSKKLNRVIPESQKDIITDIFLSTALKIEIAEFEIDNYMNRYHYFFESLKKVNGIHVNLLTEIIEQIHQQFDINFQSYIYELVFFFYTNVNELRSFKSINIGVVSNFGLEHTKSIV